jgi:hypothetical protein
MPRKWKPIEDLPENWADLTDGELTPLLQFWQDQQADFEQNGSLRKFLGQLTREWAIETGQIEGVYDIDHGITRTLIERGINAD